MSSHSNPGLHPPSISNPIIILPKNVDEGMLNKEKRHPRKKFIFYMFVLPSNVVNYAALDQFQRTLNGMITSLVDMFSNFSPF